LERLGFNRAQGKKKGAVASERKSRKTNITTRPTSKGRRRAILRRTERAKTSKRVPVVKVGDEKGD